MIELDLDLLTEYYLDWLVQAVDYDNFECNSAKANFCKHFLELSGIQLHTDGRRTFPQGKILDKEKAVLFLLSGYDQTLSL